MLLNFAHYRAEWEEFETGGEKIWTMFLGVFDSRWSGFGVWFLVLWRVTDELSADLHLYISAGNDLSWFSRKTGEVATLAITSCRDVSSDSCLGWASWKPTRLKHPKIHAFSSRCFVEFCRLRRIPLAEPQNDRPLAPPQRRRNPPLPA